MLIKAFKSIWSTTKKANSLKKEFETKFVEDCNVKINNRHRDFLKKLLYNLDSPESPYGPRALELYLNHLGIPLTVEEEETLIEQPPSASEIQEMFHILEMLDGIPTIDEINYELSLKLHETKYSQKENIEFEKMKQKRKIFSQLNDNERQKFIELRIGSIGKSTDTKKKLKLLKEPPNDIELSIISD